MAETQEKPQGPQTTGHVWDGDLQEYNNPLPQWWIYGFYVTILFALVYWIVYPSWPVGQGFLTGVNSITYTNSQGQEETWHWNTRAKLMREMEAAAVQQRPWFERIAQMPYDQIVKDPELMGFVRSAGRALFNENCAGCHQVGGGGKIGHYPNLTDDNWIYGGSFDKIRESIVQGRRGYMPLFGEVLSRGQIDALAHYVLSMSGEPHNAAQAAEGKALFHSHTAACYYCHGDDGKGRQDIGAANLTDRIWVWADVPGTTDVPGKAALIRQIIAGGLNRGNMPAWQGRLSEEQIKVLTVYVHQLGGGQ